MVHPKVKRAAYVLSVLAVWGIILGSILVAIIAWDLPDVDEAIQAERAATVRIVSLDGIELARRGDFYGIAVQLAEVPPTLPMAILATEDRRFYDHFGIDVIGIARAMWVNIKAGGIRQGGSSLTQQAAKNLFLTPKRTLKRKLQEVLLALWLEAKFSKDEILTIYLNRVYFGRGVYGVDAAARYYFNTPAAKLSDYHAMMLAGMLKGPNKYNPFSNLKRAKARTEVVVQNMVRAGYYSQADADAVARPTRWKRGPTKSGAPKARHFADWVLSQVGDFVTLDQDVTVIVTLNTQYQKFAEDAVSELFKKGSPAQKRNVGEVALVAMAPDGAVVAMVGGRDYNTSKFNRAVQAKRQPGSAFKPIVFLAGFDAGLTPATPMTDEAITIDDWSPRNFKNEFLGQMTLSDAMTRSINTIAVKVSEQAGRDNVRAKAKKVGITSTLTSAPSLALGVSEVSLLEITSAYGTFATGGLGLWPYGISEIQDMDGKPLYVRSGGGPGRVISKTHAGYINAMLSKVITDKKGTGKAARLRVPAAGKTGTSQGYRDAWFVGYTPDLITGVWMGNDKGAPMKGVTGGSFPAKLWKSFMTKATAHSTAKALPKAPEKSTFEKIQTDPAKTIKSFFDNLLNDLFGG